MASPSSRYNLHKLGWYEFEELCGHVLRSVLGETVTIYPKGPDGGVDACFEGVAKGRLRDENRLKGRFVSQSKFTGKVAQPFPKSVLNEELPKIRCLASGEPLHYIWLTNYIVSVDREKQIKEETEKLLNGGRCLVLDQMWIENQLDASPILKRLVPRLYGIGQLAELFSERIEVQTLAFLEDGQDAISKFVATESYRKAQRSIEEHGFVFLVGPPTAGKSTIAHALCFNAIETNENMRILRLTSAEDLKTVWNPSDTNTLYWADDIFGETTFDHAQFNEWSRIMSSHVQSMVRRKTPLIFCSRDYIFNDALTQFKFNHRELFEDNKVVVHVDALSPKERHKILYNHIKHGSLATEQKRALKPVLEFAGDLDGFQPELARRLGDARLTLKKPITGPRIRSFIEEPVDHFRDIVLGLSQAEQAALQLVLLNDNKLEYPVASSEKLNLVISAYKTELSQIRQALTAMKGSFVRHETGDDRKYWTLHHPSMVDALQNALKENEELIDLYVAAAELRQLCRESTCLVDTHDRLLFLPANTYDVLIRRFREDCVRDVSEYLIIFLAQRASNALLEKIVAEWPELLQKGFSKVFSNVDICATFDLYTRLHDLNPSILTETIKDSFENAIFDNALDFGSFHVFGADRFVDLRQDLILKLLNELIEDDGQALWNFYDGARDSIETSDQIDDILGEIIENIHYFSSLVNRWGLEDEFNVDFFHPTFNDIERELDELRSELEENETREAYNREEYEDMLREQRKDDRLQFAESTPINIFANPTGTYSHLYSDVDE